jgi:NAD(P)-dependent dehydrogenase (short-subunit alcohol dehydrogenase family)
VTAEPREEPRGGVVIVTGAGQGIGRGIAHHLGAHGSAIVVADWKSHRVDRTTTELTELGVSTLGVECDISQRSQVDEMVARTVEHFGRVDALVNNAHTFTAKADLTSVSEADIDVNETAVKGTLWAMQAVYPHFRTAGRGRIVNVASAAGIVGMSGYGAYNAAKEAIRALTRTAAREWAGHGIVVNCICPGAASKRGQDAAARNEDEYRRFIVEHPMGRQGDPETDIAPVVRFLCSEGCRYMTGQTLMVDGGAFLFA